MRTGILGLLCVGLLALVSVPAESGGKKKFVAVDPKEAGPDWEVQGEYIGQIGNLKYGAEVIARGDGNFDVNVVTGGLRGEGGDSKLLFKAMAKTDGGKITVTSKDGIDITMADGIMKTNVSGLEGTLKKIIRKSKTLGMKAPEGAVVLYGGPEDVKNWGNGQVVDGNLLGSEIDSKQKFKDHKIHLEFRLSFMPFDGGQGRSNSGVYPQHRYEVQVLDSFGLKGESNECGGIYSQAAPLVNMCYPPLTWQTYDIDFKTARFDADGKKIADAVITVLHNGVKIHDNFKLAKGPTGGGHKETAEGGPLHLQGHGGQVQYKNIWVVDMDEKGSAKN